MYTNYSNKKYFIDQSLEKIEQAPERTEQDFFHLLPEEMIIKIFSKFNKHVDLGRCGMVSKRWQVLANDQTLWNALIPEIAIGKIEWESFFGDIGEVPPLPKNIDQILDSDCPIWKGKKVRETHILMLIPKTIDGEQISLNKLRELARFPKQGNTADYKVVKSRQSILWAIIAQLGDKSIDSSYWILMTKDVIPESRNKNYLKQQIIINDLNHCSQAKYDVPTALEATTCIFLEHIINRNQLYKQFSPSNATRCQEELESYEDYKRLYIGNFSLVFPKLGSRNLKGELLLSVSSHDDESVGVAAVRKLMSPCSKVQ